MNKKNILLIIFLALFLIPELLWSPVSSIFLSFFDIYDIGRDTLLDDVSINIVSSIIALQSIGIIGATVMLFKLASRFKGTRKTSIIVLSSFCVVFSVVSLFVFLISISLRNIGF